MPIKRQKFFLLAICAGCWGWVWVWVGVSMWFTLESPQLKYSLYFSYWPTDKPSCISFLFVRAKRKKYRGERRKELKSFERKFEKEGRRTRTCHMPLATHDMMEFKESLKSYANANKTFNFGQLEKVKS